MHLGFALRHLVRHWRMHLAVLAGMVLCGALVAALPLYAATIAADSLSQSLRSAFAFVRNLEVRGDQLSQHERQQLYSTVGDYVKADYELQEATANAERAVYDAEHGLRRLDEVLFLRLWSIPTAGHVDVVAGRLPGAEPVGTSNGNEVLEAAVGALAQEQIDVGIGDELVMEDPPYRIRVVGVLSPRDPSSDLWWSDPLLSPFSVERQPTNQVDNLYLSLILAPETMRERIPQSEGYWRVLLDWETIGVDTAQQVRDRLVELKAHLSASGVEASTGLIALLDRYGSQLRLGKASLLLLTAQSFLAALYVLATVSAFLVDQSRIEFASLIGRGFGQWQITLLLGVEMAVLAIPALPAGPLIAYALFRAWSALTGRPVAQRLPPEVWWLAAAAVAAAWLSLLISARAACREGLLSQLRQRGRLVETSPWQRLASEVFLVTLGGLAYWQLRQTGTFVRETGGPGSVAVDPVLLLGPSLFLLALGLAFLRSFPAVLRLLAHLTQGVRDLVLPLAIARLSRLMGRVNQVTLLITLTTALVFFATAFRSSIVRRQGEVAHYVTGADVRVALPASETASATRAALIESMAGVTAVARVFRSQARWSPFRVAIVNTQPVSFLAVERDRLAEVARYPPEIGSTKMSGLMAALGQHSSDAVPILASSDAPPGDLKVGSVVRYALGTRACDFEVRGIVDEFPTLHRPFVVADLHALSTCLDLGGLSLDSSTGRELWLELAERQRDVTLGRLDEQLVDAADVGRFTSGRIVADASTQLRAFQADLVARVTVAAFGLNAVVLVALSAGSFLLVQVFAARGRATEFGILRAIGLGGGQVLGLLSVEACTMLILGLSAGTAVGYGLALVMRPFLSLTLTSSIGERAIARLVVDWAALGTAYAVLLTVYVVALLILLGALARSRIRQALWLGDE